MQMILKWKLLLVFFCDSFICSLFSERTIFRVNFQSSNESVQSRHSWFYSFSCCLHQPETEDYLSSEKGDHYQILRMFLFSSGAEKVTSFGFRPLLGKLIDNNPIWRRTPRTCINVGLPAKLTLVQQKSLLFNKKQIKIFGAFPGMLYSVSHHLLGDIF